ncbi:sulfur carrier protein ThiS [Austwickia chelonae]|uniref:Thiazole biosynthesis protein ThiS n=1 Tax=Austwickia chelonae NBRC 105200 TaxID=1184607 RepID=K6VUW4_9MICO|nr:sulfur carrier protein ThiS [Austwickia chelonae]GAB79120.1 thiazole biosynthesis protein ThiS [Austwickia chelonae NBRC 105200]SEW42433.1 sulfur carrier protein ThiS [Austwickia chelonae]
MIVVNGESRPWQTDQTLASLVESEGYRRERIAVEVNGRIVPKVSFDEHVLADGDLVEIVHFVGGG